MQGDCAAFLEGKVVGRGHGHIPPAPKQVLPQAQPHCYAKRAGSLLIANHHLPLRLLFRPPRPSTINERTAALCLFARRGRSSIACTFPLVSSLPAINCQTHIFSQSRHLQRLPHRTFAPNVTPAPYVDDESSSNLPLKNPPR